MDQEIAKENFRRQREDAGQMAKGCETAAEAPRKPTEEEEVQKLTTLLEDRRTHFLKQIENVETALKILRREPGAIKIIKALNF